MNNLDFRESYSKNMLRKLLKMKITYFKTWLRNLEPEILLIDKQYNKYSSILSPKIFRFLLVEYGFEDSEEVNKMIRDYYKCMGINQDES